MHSVLADRINDIPRIRSMPVFFILGNMRSGSTLLRMLFDTHPNVSIPAECPFIILLYKKYHKVPEWNPEVLQRFTDDLYRIRKFNTWNINKEELYKNLLKLGTDCSYQTICKAVILSYPSIFPKENIILLGDKNPVYSILSQELYKIFPEASFIHIVRDYRDQVTSSKKVKFVISLTASICYHWKRTVHIIEKIKQQHPAQFYTIRYEDLVSSPEEHLKEMCNLLHIPFTSKIMDFHLKKDEFSKEYTEYSMEHHHKSLTSPVNTKSVEVWKKELAPRHVRLADHVIGRSAEKYGYKKKYPSFNLLTFLHSLPGIAIMSYRHMLWNLLLRLPLSASIFYYSTLPLMQRFYHLFIRNK